MINDTTEAGMVCQCGHPALTHVHPETNEEWCAEQWCDCVEFRQPEEDDVQPKKMVLS